MKHLRAPSWLAPIVLWYEQTMSALSEQSAGNVSGPVGRARSWWRHFEQEGMVPLRPVVLSQHARERCRERYGIDPDHLDMQAFRFCAQRSAAGTKIVTNGTVYLAVSREKKRYYARTALTADLTAEAVQKGQGSG